MALASFPLEFPVQTTPSFRGERRGKEAQREQQQLQQQHRKQWLAPRERNGSSDPFLTPVILVPLDSAPDLVLPVTGHVRSARPHRAP